MSNMITLTPKAVGKVKEIVSQSSGEALGLRVGIAQKGCSGLAYVVEYAKEKRAYEEVIEQDGVSVFIDPAAQMFLIGSSMDYEDGRFASGFVFSNPNEKGRCGCGESFIV